MGGTGNDHGGRTGGPRLIALIGPFQSGKTKLFEALLERTGATREGAGVGDASPEARAHQMSVEANIGHADYLGDQYTFIDLPGSMEFAHEARNVLPLVDAAVVVCEADPRKVFSLQLALRELEELRVPHFLFVNKIDAAGLGVRETLAMLQPASRTPLLARQMPIWKNGVAIGFIDLALERAYVYREHALSEVVAIPSGDAAQEKEQRYSMLERLADYDDELMEELISDIEPPRDQVFDDLAKELREGLVVPLFFGSAARGAGVTRLLKALRHEAPGIETTRARLGVSDKGPPLARVLRTIHTSHGGKLSLARVLLHDPKVLLLDEPASGLDPIFQRFVIDLMIDASANGATVLFSSHQITQVERAADRVAILKKGRLVLDAEVDALKSDEKVVEAVFDHTVPGLDVIANDVRVRRFERSGRIVRAYVHTDAGEIMRRLVEFGPRSVNILDLNLEDIFLNAVEAGRATTTEKP